jgi:hypothetical protein
MHESEEPSAIRTYNTLSWFGAIGVSTSLYVAGRYFEGWLLTNDPEAHPLVEEFIEQPVKMLTETPAVMATKPVLSVVLSGILLATLCYRLFLFAVAQFSLLCWSQA